MNVSFATTWDSRCGIAVYSRSLVAELRKTVDVRIISLDPDAVRSPIRLAAEMNEADIVHIQHQYPFFGGMAVYRNTLRQVVTKLKKPLVMTVHELDIGDGESSPMRAYKRWFNSRLFGGCEVDRFIVHTRDYWAKLDGLGIPPEHIKVIPEGVPQVEVSDLSDADAKREFGLTEKRVLTIFGFVVRRKGYDLALDALKNLPSDVSLLIAGGCHPDDSTGFIDDMRARIAREGLSRRVVVTDYLPDARIPLVMAATDVVLAPFTDMSNSGSVLRSIAYARPIVASDLPGMRELYARRQCISLCKPGDADDLAEKSLAYLENEWMRKTAQSEAAAYARDYSVARAADETVEVYKELLV